MEERYNDTRRWRCYEAVLLMKENEIRTDRKHPPKGQKFFLGKEKKDKSIFLFP
jgi:hypothetical protein